MNNDQKRSILLKTIYEAAKGHMSEIVRTTNIDELLKKIADNPYESEDDLQSDILFLEERGYVSTIKAGVGIVAVRINSYGIEEVESFKNKKEGDVRIDVAAKLSHLYTDKDKLIGGDITSSEGLHWLANVSALIGLVDLDSKRQFEELAHKVILPLSDQTRVPIWNSIILIIESTIASLDAIGQASPEHIYPAGQIYDFYRDLKRIIASSKSELFIIDPYIDEQLFDSYLSSVPKSVRSRLLTKSPSPTMEKVINLYRSQTGPSFECRSSNEIHDRVISIENAVCYVIGQSIKDAAAKKPTYITQIYSIDMIRLYEDIWSRASKITE